MRPARPTGFVFLAACALFCAGLMAVALAIPWVSPAERFAFGATGALALVEAEALALVRPWAFGAAVAFAGSCIAMLLVLAVRMEAFLGLAVLTALFTFVALSIVHNGMRSVPTAPRLQRRGVLRTP